MSETSRIGAAIDVGSNSVHLLVVALEGDLRRVIRDESELLGLGAVVDMEGRIPDEAAAAAVELVRGYVADRRGGRGRLDRPAGHRAAAPGLQPDALLRPGAAGHGPARSTCSATRRRPS